MNENRYLKGTNLIIRQDTTDRFTALKGDILKEIRSSENEVNEKDLRLAKLESELAKNNYDDKKLLKEANVLFPEITGFAVSSQSLINVNDSVANTVTAVIYTSARETPRHR
jgi:hypothetical protein